MRQPSWMRWRQAWAYEKTEKMQSHETPSLAHTHATHSLLRRRPNSPMAPADTQANRPLLRRPPSIPMALADPHAAHSLLWCRRDAPSRPAPWAVAPSTTLANAWRKRRVCGNASGGAPDPHGRGWHDHTIIVASLASQHGSRWRPRLAESQLRPGGQWGLPAPGWLPSRPPRSSPRGPLHLRRAAEHRASYALTAQDRTNDDSVAEMCHHCIQDIPRLRRRPRPTQ
mmetsp:Transcript_31230/g.85712  ORF Transcript_31230/g.85712 Transcript_31230/m.85712 type:complete len:227 (-) Transcript_31230:947-1627(-)